MVFKTLWFLVLTALYSMMCLCYLWCVCVCDGLDVWTSAGNSVTSVFLPLALIATCVAIAAKFAGTHHLRVWRTDSLAAAAATALIALLLTLLALGCVLQTTPSGCCCTAHFTLWIRDEQIFMIDLITWYWGRFIFIRELVWNWKVGYFQSDSWWRI